MIHEHSRLTITSITEYENSATGKLRRHRYPDIRDRITAEASDDKFVTATTAKQWPHLGSQYLDDARNWWAIADLSGIVDPFTELVDEVAVDGIELVPKTLRIPSMSRFLFRIITGEETP